MRYQNGLSELNRTRPSDIHCSGLTSIRGPSWRFRHALRLANARLDLVRYQRLASTNAGSQQ